jgi:hypothetical protein
LTFAPESYAAFTTRVRLVDDRPYGRMLIDVIAEELIRPLVARTNALEAKLARVTETLDEAQKALEARPGLKYAGIWKAGTDYHVGDFVTHAWSLWHVNSTTKNSIVSAELGERVVDVLKLRLSVLSKVPNRQRRNATLHAWRIESRTATSWRDSSGATRSLRKRDRVSRCGRPVQRRAAQGRVVLPERSDGTLALAFCRVHEDRTLIEFGTSNAGTRGRPLRYVAALNPTRHFNSFKDLEPMTDEPRNRAMQTRPFYTRSFCTRSPDAARLQHCGARG